MAAHAWHRPFGTHEVAAVGRACYPAAWMSVVEAIHVAAGAGQPMQARPWVEAIVGCGLLGDRYADQTGYYSARPTDPGAREVTLVEAEALQAVEAETQLAFGAHEHRRNLTTRGVRLADLVGQTFRVGDVLLEGVRDCPPCEHLEQVTGKAVMRALVGRGGLRARVVQGGTIRVGDPIVARTAVLGAPGGPAE